MPGISETIARLGAMKRGLGLMSATGAPDRLTDLNEFGANPGSLRAHTYVPSGLKRGAPLVVVLHGCTQTAAAYDYHSGWSRLADREGFAVLFPEQQRQNNPNLCFNWFAPADIRRGAGEVASIAQMIATLVRQQGLDADRVFVTGLSAGGAMAAAMLATYPELFAAGAIIAGLPYACAGSIPEAFERMRGQGLGNTAAASNAVVNAAPQTQRRPRLSVWHGDADSTANVANADAIVAQWAGVLGAKPSGRTQSIGRTTRQVWLDANSTEVIEQIIVADMGHGTPLDPSSGIGAAGPFMLDVGVSSTEHIARFWGIAGEASIVIEGTVLKAAPQPSAPASRSVAPARVPILPSPLAPKPASGKAAYIQKTIEDALRAAGLMR